MAAECLAAIHLCRIRATRLNPDGSPMSGADNVYVSDKPMVWNVNPNILQGDDKDLVGGCDCLIATYKGYDKLKRFDFELDLGVIEPGLLEMLTGGTAILDTGVPIGVWWPVRQFDCSVQAQPPICFEGWQDAWNDDEPDLTWPYIHWIYPMTFWSIGQYQAQNDFGQPKLTGFSRGSSAWGEGIFGDLPEAAQALGGGFYSTTIPTAACGYQTQAIT